MAYFSMEGIIERLDIIIDKLDNITLDKKECRPSSGDKRNFIIETMSIIIAFLSPIFLMLYFHYIFVQAIDNMGNASINSSYAEAVKNLTVLF